MNINSQKGFAIIPLIIILAVLGVGGYWWWQKDSKTTEVPSDGSAGLTTNWRTYRNEKYGFEVKYPGDWTFKESSQAEIITGRLVSLRSPETEQLLRDRKIDPGYSYNLVISFWPNVNNEYARGGSWAGQRIYNNLADYFTDKNAPKQKIGEIMINGQKAYEVNIGGAGSNYGVVIEHNGIYELSFETVSGKSGISSTENQILSTFKFLK